MDGTQIYDNFTAGRPEVLQAWGDSIAELSAGYGDEAKAIDDLQKSMNQYWTGASGDAASAGAGPLAAAFRDSSVPLDETNKLMSVQSASLDNAKSSVVPVPPAPDKPSGWSLALKSAIPVAGPFMAAGDVNSYQDGVAAHNAANETNVRVMDQYANVTSGNQGNIPMDYQPLGLDGHSVSVTSPSLAVEGGVAAGHIDTTNSSYSPSINGSAGNVSGGGPVSSGPALNGPGTTASGPDGRWPNAQIGTSPSLNGPASPAPTGGGNTVVPGYTDPSGKTTDGKSSTGGGKNPSRGNASSRLFDDTENPGGGRRASETGSGKSGSGRPGAAEEERIGRGNSAGERLTGRGAGAGESASRGLGAGKGSGSGFGNAAAAEEAAASRASGARGANGAPIGAAGQRGRDDEDEEHQRPDYLIEPDPDSLFGADVHTAPPVIGE